MRKSSIAALSALASGLGLAGCASVGDPVALPVCPTETRSWTAWINAMPGPGATPTLIVTGEALLPDRASATLAAGPTDRKMPPSQRVMLDVVASDRAAGWQPIRLEISPALPEYASVIVGCEGSEVVVISPVETAQ